MQRIVLRAKNVHLELGRITLSRQPSYQFSKLTLNQIQKSTYNELVQKMAKTYGYQEFKSKSALAVLQMHHLYGIFRPGQRVLDIGAGPRYGWTNLALKYARTSSNTGVPYQDMVFAVDKTGLPSVRGVTTIKGDITNTEVQLEVLTKLGPQKLFDVVLFDAMPEYTGNLFGDRRRLNNTVMSVLQLMYRVLRRGGTFVFKSLLGAGMAKDPILQPELRRAFSNVTPYKPLYLESLSPVQYYVSKGFMQGEIYYAVEEFSNTYNFLKSSKAREKLLQQYSTKYQEKYDFRKMLVKQVESFIMNSLRQGKNEEEILAGLRRDEFLGIEEMLKKCSRILKIERDGSEEDRKGLLREMIKQYGHPNAAETQLLINALKSDEQTLMEELRNAEQIEKALFPQLDEEKLDSKGQKIKEDEPLLGDQENYMNDALQQENALEYNYRPQDLDEDLVLGDPGSGFDAELEIAKKQIPGFAEALSRFQNKKGGLDLDKMTQDLVKRINPDFDPKVMSKSLQEKIMRFDGTARQDEFAQSNDFNEVPNQLKREKNDQKIRSGRVKRASRRKQE